MVAVKLEEDVGEMLVRRSLGPKREMLGSS